MPSLTSLPKSVAEDPRNVDWEDRWYDIINGAIASYRRLGAEYKAAFDRVDARLAKVTGIEALRLTVKGNFLMHWGWEARSQRFASQVTEEQFRTFETRLQQARTALNEAWKAKPDEPNVADLMLEVEKAIGGGDREAMETWFERAMKANGNDRDGVLVEARLARPQMVRGRFVRCDDGLRQGLRRDQELADRDLPARRGRPPALSPATSSREQRAMYLRQAGVWSDIQPAYDEYLKHYPDDQCRAEQVCRALLPVGPLPRGARAVPDPRRQPHHLDDLPVLPARVDEADAGRCRAIRRRQAARRRHQGRRGCQALIQELESRLQPVRIRFRLKATVNDARYRGKVSVWYPFHPLYRTHDLSVVRKFGCYDVEYVRTRCSRAASGAGLDARSGALRR